MSPSSHRGLHSSGAGSAGSWSLSTELNNFSEFLLGPAVLGKASRACAGEKEPVPTSEKFLTWSWINHNKIRKTILFIPPSWGLKEEIYPANGISHVLTTSQENLQE